MAAYMRKTGILPVCTNNEARDYFAGKGLSYDDVTEGDILTLISCFLYVNSHYFERRECISFNADGWIGFAGWADQGNTNPILRAFIEWCDQLAADKEG